MSALTPTQSHQFISVRTGKTKPLFLAGYSMNNWIIQHDWISILMNKTAKRKVTVTLMVAYIVNMNVKNMMTNQTIACI